MGKDQPRENNGQWAKSPVTGKTPPIVTPHLSFVSLPGEEDANGRNTSVDAAWDAFFYRGVGEEQYVKDHTEPYEYSEKVIRTFSSGEPWREKTTRSLATGELAQRAREAFGVDDENVDVFIVYKHTDDGYSEVTREDRMEHSLECGDQRKTFGTGWSRNGLEELLAWLDNGGDSDDGE